MRELLDIFYRKFRSMMMDLMIGYNIEDMDLTELWDLAHAIHLVENIEVSDEDIRALSNKYNTKRYLF